MALSSRERGWLATHQKGSKERIRALDKAHANNDEYQAFKKRHGLDKTSSVKQVSKSQVDAAKQKARAALSLKAHGATRGTRMGGEDGRGEEIRDTIAPLTRDQHSAVKTAEKSAKVAAAPKKQPKPKAKKPEEKPAPSRLDLIKQMAAKRKFNAPPVSAKQLRTIAAVGGQEHDHGGFDDLAGTGFEGRGGRNIDESMIDDFVRNKIAAYHSGKVKGNIEQSDNARQDLTKKLTPIKRKIQRIRARASFKDTEHPKHAETQLDLKHAKAEHDSVAAERATHYNAFKKATADMKANIASDNETYNKFGLVGLGLKRLKQKSQEGTAMKEGILSKLLGKKPVQKPKTTPAHKSVGYQGLPAEWSQEKRGNEYDANKQMAGLKKEETQTDSWKNVQAMDRGSVTGSKEEVKKHLAYLTAAYNHHKKYGNDTLKLRDKIGRINRMLTQNEEVEQIDEMKYGIGTIVKLKNPIDGHGYARVKGITGSSHTRGATGRGVPMPAGKVTKVKVALRKTGDDSYYPGPEAHITHDNIHSVVNVKEEAMMKNNDAPFEGGKTPSKNKGIVAGKSRPEGMSRVRHLARLAMRKKMKEEVEQIDEDSKTIKAHGNEKATHVVHLRQNPKGHAGWRGSGRTLNVHVAANSDDDAKKKALKAVKGHETNNWEEPYVPSNYNPVERLGEEVEQIDEAANELTPEHKEKIISHMKNKYGPGRVRIQDNGGYVSHRTSDGEEYSHRIKLRDGKLSVEKQPFSHSQIDESSAELLRRYGSKAMRAYLDAKAKGKTKKAAKRARGVNLASAKLFPDQYANSPKQAKVPATNEEPKKRQVEPPPEAMPSDERVIKKPKGKGRPGRPGSTNKFGNWVPGNQNEEVQQVDERFRDAADERDYVNHHYNNFQKRDKVARQAANLADKGVGNTAITRDQLARRDALASALRSHADVSSSRVADSHADMNNPNSAPAVHARAAGAARGTVRRLTAKIRSNQNEETMKPKDMAKIVARINAKKLGATLPPKARPPIEKKSVNEVLKPSMGASAYIHDFVHSKNPKFAGKSKAERTRMALGAFYGAKKGMKEALDPVGKEDTDVNNDGKHGHSTDKYLLKRRAAISKAIASKKGK